jgi:hypothetical protein
MLFRFLGCILSFEAQERELSVMIFFEDDANICQFPEFLERLLEAFLIEVLRNILHN